MMQLPDTIATYEEVAEALGMTRSGARRLEQRALRKLKRALSRKMLTFDDLLPTHTQYERGTEWDTEE
jgi:DNA-directed RNA polymerase sigma subunit (sigma70/sigma32)